MTESRPLSLWETLILTAQLKAKKVLKKGLGVVGIALWCILCAGFLFRFIALAFNSGWSGADWLITWTSKLFR